MKGLGTLLLAGALWAQAVPAPEIRTPPPWEVWRRLGQLRLRERAAWHFRRFTSRGLGQPNLPGLTVVPAGTERDQEFQNLLEVETNGLLHPRLRTYAQVEWRKDVDGTRDPSFHKNIVTAAPHRALLRLHALWAEVRDERERLTLRVGRQAAVEAHAVLFDGVALRLEKLRLFGWPAVVRLHGGRLVSDFNRLRRDGAFGGGLVLSPHRRFTLEVRESHTVRNRLDLQVHWVPADSLRLSGLYGWFDASPREGRVEGRWAWLPALELQAGYGERYEHDYRLDGLAEVTARRLGRWLRLARPGPFREVFVGIAWAPQAPVAMGVRWTRRRLRRSRRATVLDTDFDRVAGYADLRLGPLRLRGEGRYSGYRRPAVPLLIPRAPPAPSRVARARSGEKRHFELHGNLTWEVPGLGLQAYGGVVWHGLAHEEPQGRLRRGAAVDYRAELHLPLGDRARLTIRYERSRDFIFFFPYFRRYQALSWILSVTW